MRIGLLGFGVVGKGLYDLMQGREDMQIAQSRKQEQDDALPQPYTKALPSQDEREYRLQ